MKTKPVFCVLILVLLATSCSKERLSKDTSLVFAVALLDAEAYPDGRLEYKDGIEELYRVVVPVPASNTPQSITCINGDMWIEAKWSEYKISDDGTKIELKDFSYCLKNWVRFRTHRQKGGPGEREEIHLSGEWKRLQTPICISENTSKLKDVEGQNDQRLWCLLLKWQKGTLVPKDLKLDDSNVDWSLFL